jgi:transcriptional regulator GlxA family with amidase domain
MNANRVFFYINSRTHILDLAGAVQVFHEAVIYGIEYEIRYVSDCTEQISSANLNFANLELFSNIEILDTDIIVIAGFSLGELPKVKADVFHWLRKANKVNATICSVCTGCFTLAAAGLLDNKECTTHWNFTERLQKAYPKV